MRKLLVLALLAFGIGTATVAHAATSADGTGWCCPCGCT
jgi:hypothetical protein